MSDFDGSHHEPIVLCARLVFWAPIKYNWFGLGFHAPKIDASQLPFLFSFFFCFAKTFGLFCEKRRQFARGCSYFEYFILTGQRKMDRRPNTI